MVDLDKPPREARVYSWPILLARNTEEAMVNSVPAKPLPFGSSKKARIRSNLTGP